MFKKIVMPFLFALICSLDSVSADSLSIENTLIAPVVKPKTCEYFYSTNPESGGGSGEGSELENARKADCELIDCNDPANAPKCEARGISTYPTLTLDEKQADGSTKKTHYTDAKEIKLILKGRNSRN